MVDSQFVVAGIPEPKEDSTVIGIVYLSAFESIIIVCRIAGAVVGAVVGVVVGVILGVAVAVGVVVIIFKCCSLIAKRKGSGAQSHGRYNLAIYIPA